MIMKMLQPGQFYSPFAPPAMGRHGSSQNILARIIIYFQSFTEICTAERRLFWQRAVVVV
jgi:hypothetical protein